MIQSFAASSYASSFSGSKPPRLISASRIDSRDTVYPRILHKHDSFFELLFVRSGSGSYIIDEQPYPIQAGDLILCNAGVLHDEDPSNSVGLNMLSVAVTDLSLNGLPVNHLIASQYAPVFSAGEYSEMIESLLLSIFNLLAERSVGSTEVCQHLTIALMGILLMRIQQRYLAEETFAAGKGNLLAVQAKKYINDHYNEDICLNDLADALHVSVYHLAHVFKRHTGYSPKQYMLRRRLGEAQTLLISTELSITDVSASVGYGNPNDFHRIFAKHIGMSPSAYRAFYVDRDIKKAAGR